MTVETRPPPLITDHKPRCWRCRRLLAIEVTRPWEIRCTRCKTRNRSEPMGGRGAGVGGDE